jgi:hypothetical protein
MPENPGEQIFSSSKFYSVVDEAIDFFSKTPIHELPPAAGFTGVGVYGLYYKGDFEEYHRITEMNKVTLVQPIYVGKTVPEGWRTARITKLTSKSLYKRLQEHAKNINLANNLRSEDFKCRYMVFGEMEMGLIGVVEAQLIRRYNPLWNTVIDGFGNHDPGGGRYNQAKSDWDVLHPGRPWGDKLMGAAPSLDRVIRKVRQHFG